MPDEVDALRRRQYRDPPVVEAIARLQWSSPVPWSFTTPGVLFERLREAYPEEPTAQAVVRAEVMSPEDASASEAGMDSGFQFSAGPQRIMFAQAAGTRLLGVSATGISAHSLPPYEGWESLEGRLTQGLQRIRPIVGDGKVSVVSVRYINRVELSAPEVDFEDYLTISIGFPPEYPPKITAFLDRVEMEYPGEHVKLAFTWASTEAPEGHSAFILDLDLIATFEDPQSPEAAIEALREVKVKEGRAFEGLLQDRLRKEFGEIPG